MAVDLSLHLYALLSGLLVGEELSYNFERSGKRRSDFKASINPFLL